MFPWTIPTELACFIFDQFVRFEAQAPSNRCINVIGEFVLKYVSDNNYFPRSADEAVDRYQHPGLTEPEKYALIGPLEYRLKAQLFESITIDQLHLAAWAALLFCWSEGGDEHVAWYKKISTKVPFRAFG